MTSRAVLSVVAVVALGGIAAADPKADAQVHIDNASRLHGEGKLAEALQELKDAYVLDPRPELLFAIGQIHVNLGECTEAITYYERYLGTRPDRDAADVTRQAIETCKKNPPPKKDEPKKDEPKKDEPKKIEPAVVQPEAPPPWYTDVVADGLLGGGLVLGLAGGIVYGKARSDRSKADDITSFERYSDQIDHAKRERTVSVILGVTGAGLVIGGVVRVLTHQRSSGIAIAPTPGGAAVSWTRGF